MKRALWGIGTAMLAVLAASPATAEPDPHIPDLSAGYCPGHKANLYGSRIGVGYCDGMHYPDGSFWRILQTGVPGPQTLQCVVNPAGDGLATPAPPGGCNGAV